MKVEIFRHLRTNNCTHGKMYIEGKYFCDTLEDTDRFLRQNMTPNEVARIKVKNKTCIPSGKYNIKLTRSNRFKISLPLIEDVIGFEGIRIHAGNTPEDTEGCILLGDYQSEGIVINSRVKVGEFIMLLTNEIINKRPSILFIK